MDEVATKIIDILKKHMKEPREDIDLSTALTDLKIESLDLAMIVFDIEDTFGIEIPYNANEEAADFKTVGSVVDRVKALMANAGGAAASAKASCRSASSRCSCCPACPTTTMKAWPSTMRKKCGCRPTWAPPITWCCATTA